MEHERGNERSLLVVLIKMIAANVCLCRLLSLSHLSKLYICSITYVDCWMMHEGFEIDFHYFEVDFE